MRNLCDGITGLNQGRAIGAARLLTKSNLKLNSVSETRGGKSSWSSKEGLREAMVKAVFQELRLAQSQGSDLVFQASGLKQSCPGS